MSTSYNATTKTPQFCLYYYKIYITYLQRKMYIMYLHRKMYTFLNEYLQPCSFFSIFRIALFIPHCPQNEKACSVN